MIYLDVEQGSPEWHALRCGRVTASRVADIVRRTKSGPSASRQRYLGELVAERLTGQPAGGFRTSADMDWGNATEPEASDAYCFYRGAKVQIVAFVDHPSISMAGASPDRLVGDDGLVEIKCPATHTHIATLLGEPVDADYLTQMQWQMACTGRQWCDWVSYDPRLPEEMRLHVGRVNRDADRIAELEAAVVAFIGEVDAIEAMLRQKYMSK